MPLRPIVTEGTRADCKEASKLIQDIVAEYLLADKAYDTEEIIKKAEEQSMQIVIPPKRNRKSKQLKRATVQTSMKSVIKKKNLS